VTPAQIVDYRSGSVTIETDASDARIMMLNDANVPGWQASLDDAPVPILTADYFFRAVAVPPGKHVILFSFEPATVRVAGSISLLAVLLMIGAIVADVRLQRPGDDAIPTDRWSRE
jgi:uncharacterized membrane protein YfhO